MEIVPHPQHQSTNSDILAQIPLETASLEAILEMDAASQSQGADIIDHTDDIPVIKLLAYNLRMYLMR